MLAVHFPIPLYFSSHSITFSLLSRVSLDNDSYLDVLSDVSSFVNVAFFSTMTCLVIGGSEVLFTKDRRGLPTGYN
jgi:hypothetical protein